MHNLMGRTPLSPNLIFFINLKAAVILGVYNGPFAKYQLSDGSPLVSMVSIDENVKFPLNIQYFLKE
jgi:hypothetical protein